MPKFRTVKMQRKEITQKRLDNAGYKTWMIHRTGFHMYALIIIACNRLCPANPVKAYWAITNHLHNMLRGRNIDASKWKYAERTSSEGLRGEAAIVQEKEKLGCKCPVCGGEWDPDCESLLDQAGNEMNPDGYEFSE